MGDGKPPIHINRPPEITVEVDQERNAPRTRINQRFRVGRRESELDAYDDSFETAQQLIRRRDLFDEPDAKDAERYGLHPLGRHILQSRRLIEAGVLFVQCHSYHWDTHGDNFNVHHDPVPQNKVRYSGVRHVARSRRRF